ncbi:uncharacterized protein CELE_T16H12.13 [Caenorhabditis elegans]|uniref:Uncharacterized protein n=1 Tax=Caenorhabditis elegans TaxID=6239 RepID=C8JQQ6_CAEEL|nr:Uncharacterized protein CELE_T16H12.13 [Caenorhabditis elegans]CBB16244.1 Uncharacterized protein CELE_T16H12.13 [Caenorhabditis elegans]|eukprot:NP_001255064.1 Uncharacterized protein CELE_T16H12.13 [Caenorhabditis elegans]
MALCENVIIDALYKELISLKRRKIARRKEILKYAQRIARSSGAFTKMIQIGDSGNRMPTAIESEYNFNFSNDDISTEIHHNEEPTSKPVSSETCKFCGNRHSTDECTEYTTGESRRARLQKLLLCVFCFKQAHPSKFECARQQMNVKCCRCLRFVHHHVACDPHTKKFQINW